MASALVEAIKVAGLVLVADASNDDGDSSRLGGEFMKSILFRSGGTSDSSRDVAGLLGADGVLRFHETIDM